MKTEVIMKREIFGEIISQKSKSEFFSATDLDRAGNKWRVDNGMPFFKKEEWYRTKSTKEFIKELENKFGVVKIPAKGRNSHTWIHPYLFIDMALAINPELKIHVYEWLFDKLIEYRNDSGDSYKKMCGALYENCSNKSKFLDLIKFTARKIKAECNVEDWQSSTQEQLKLRDKMHENISLLSDVLRDNDEAIKLGIIKAKENK